MSDVPRLNGVIRALEEGRHAFGTFSPTGAAESVELSNSKFDLVIYEMEHLPWDSSALQDGMQYLLNRRRMIQSGSLAPSITPFVRVPVNGREMSQWHAKQALDNGVYGVVWPHVSTVEEAYNAVAACRYPRLKSALNYEPAGIRGDSPKAASRYWGLTAQEYYERADVWPLNPDGEILVALMIEDTTGIENLRDMIREVPGIGAIMIGEGDLSQELGHPRDYDHPTVRDHVDQVISICNEEKMILARPHVTEATLERIIAEGYRILLTPVTQNYSTLDKAIELTKKA